MMATWRSSLLSRPALLGLLFAHALAVFFTSHWHYLFVPLTRQNWFWVEFALASFIWGPAWVVLSRCLLPMFGSLSIREQRRLLGLSVLVGLIVVVWWNGTLENDFWVHTALMQRMLEWALRASRFVIGMSGFAFLLTVTLVVTRPFETRETDDDSRTITPTPRRLRILTILGFALFLLLSNAFAVWFVNQERTLYSWDYMNYWTKAGDFAILLRDGTPGAVWESFHRSTQNDDYGPIPMILPACVMAVFGDSRLVYVLAVVNLYLVPVALSAAWFVRRSLPSADWPGWVLPLLLTLLSTVAWEPILRGYLDIGGVSLGIVALGIYLSRPAGELRAKDVLLLAGLLAGMALFRRWYSFFVVAFALVIGLELAFTMLKNARTAGWKSAISRWLPMSVVGAWIVAFIVTIAPGWIIRAATTDYSQAYVAYKNAGSVIEQVNVVIAEIGPMTVAIAAIAGVILLAFRDTRRLGFIIGGMVPIILFHFLRTQSFGPHHKLLFLPALILLPTLAVSRLMRAAPGWSRFLVVAGLAGWGAVAGAILILPEAEPMQKAVRSLGPSLRVYPSTRADLPVVVDLLRTVSRELGPSGRVAIASSSFALNPTIVFAANRSLQQSLLDPSRVMITPEVDRTSDFPNGYFEAEIVLTALPVQCHLRPEEQQVIVVPAESLLQNRDIGMGFTRLPEKFVLEDPLTRKPVEVFLFRREHAISKEAMEAFRERLRLAHPNRPQLFTPPER